MRFIAIIACLTVVGCSSTKVEHIPTMDGQVRKISMYHHVNGSGAGTVIVEEVYLPPVTEEETAQAEAAMQQRLIDSGVSPAVAMSRRISKTARDDMLNGKVNGVKLNAESRDGIIKPAIVAGVQGAASGATAGVISRGAGDSIRVDADASANSSSNSNSSANASQ